MSSSDSSSEDSSHSTKLSNKVEASNRKVALRASRKTSQFNLFSLFEKLQGSNFDFIKWLKELGLLGKRYECPECMREMRLVLCKKVSDGFEWMCQRSTGNRKHCCRRSIRRGTWFERSKLTLGEIVFLTYGFVFEWPNKSILREVNGLSSGSLIDWKHICREVCMNSLICEDDAIGGVGLVIEIIECEFGKRKPKHMIVGKFAYVGVERKSNKCFVVPVPEQTPDVLISIIRRRILPGTTLTSYCWNTYDCLNDEGYVHENINRSITFKAPETGPPTMNMDQGLWSVVKRTLPPRGNGFLDGSLGEFIWRRHVLANDDLFIAFIKAVNMLYVPYECDD